MSEKDENAGQDEGKVIAFESSTRNPPGGRGQPVTGHTRLRPPGVRGNSNGCDSDHDCPPDNLCEGGHCV